MASQCQKENQPQGKSNSEPWFPQATEILFCTGNTLARFKLLPEANSTVTEQVTEYISMLLQMVETDANKKQFRAERYVKVLPAQNDTASTAANGSLDSPIDSEQLSREHIKYSVKIFLRVLEPDVLTHTIDTVLNELKETYLESVMIAVPNYARDLTVEKFMPLWRVIEDFIDKKKILSAAVCDFMLPLLSDFYDAAKHKPYGNQINLTTCCAIPDELGKYAKEKNIQLLTHGDPDDVMGDSTFQKTIRAHCHESDALNWTPCSLVRYTSVIALRGIIKSKGFFIYARRDLHAH